MATELASLRERISRTSRNSYKPPSSNGPGFRPPVRRKGSGHMRGGLPNYPGKGPDLLPIKRVDQAFKHHIQRKLYQSFCLHFISNHLRVSHHSGGE
jgi:hypothetical protein